MTDEARFVFDTNVLISALLFENGKPGRSLRRALRLGSVLVSLPVLEELAEVLQRKRFDRYVTPEEREGFLQAFVAQARLIEPEESVDSCRDPKDNKFLELAVAGGARYLVTGDDDLLALNPFRDVAIVTANQFLALTAGEEAGE
jgi:putative PIN family toxin of toxin-antitoxin system